jgi:hypothetical protein
MDDLPAHNAYYSTLLVLIATFLPHPHHSPKISASRPHPRTTHIVISISLTIKRCIDWFFFMWNGPALHALAIFAYSTFFAICAVFAVFVAFAIYAVIIITFAFILKIQRRRGEEGETKRKSRDRHQ